MNKTAVDSPLLSNGMSKPSKGFRQVVLTPTGVVRPVHNAVRDGEHSRRHTNQIARNGDLVLRHSWFPCLWELFIYEDNSLILIPGENWKQHKAALDALPQELDQWLAGDGLSYTYEASYLPAGAGWDGANTAADLRKRNAIKAFFHAMDGVEVDGELWIESIARKAQFSPFQGIPQDWDKTTPGDPSLFADQVEVIYFCTDGRAERRVSDEYGDVDNPPADALRWCAIYEGPNNTVSWDLHAK